MEQPEDFENVLKETIGITLHRDPVTGKQNLQISLLDEKTFALILQTAYGIIDFFSGKVPKVSGH